MEILTDHVDLGVALLAGGGLEHLNLLEGHVQQVDQADSFALEHSEHFDDKVAARGEDREGRHCLRLQKGGHDRLLPARVTLKITTDSADIFPIGNIYQDNRLLQ